MTETVTRLSKPYCPEWCVVDHARDGEQCYNPADDVFMCDGTPTFVELGAGDHHKRAEVFPAIAFRRDGTEVERRVYINVPESDLTVAQASWLADAIEEASSMLELDSKRPVEGQDRDDSPFMAKMIERHRAAAASFSEAEWAALGKLLLRDQLHDSGSMYVNTSDYIANISGVPLQRLWGIDEES